MDHLDILDLQRDVNYKRPQLEAHAHSHADIAPPLQIGFHDCVVILRVVHFHAGDLSHNIAIQLGVADDQNPGYKTAAFLKNFQDISVQNYTLGFLGLLCHVRL
jgi:hypothetical protein